MNKYIKMDLYRLFRSKVTYIILLVAVAIIVLASAATRIGAALSTAVKEEMEQESTMDETDKEMMESFDQLGSAMGAEHNVIKEVIDFSARKTVLLLLTLFAVIFTVAERTNGYIKNMVGKNLFRSKLILSKYFIAGFYMLAMFIVIYIAEVLSDLLILDGKLVFAITLADVMALIIQFILNMSVVAILMSLMSYFDGTAIPLVTGLMLSLGAVNIAYGGVSMLVMKVFKLEEFDIAEYLPSGNFSTAVSNASHGDLVRAALVGIIFFVVFEIITCTISEKKDIR